MENQSERVGDFCNNRPGNYRTVTNTDVNKKMRGHVDDDSVVNRCVPIETVAANNSRKRFYCKCGAWMDIPPKTKTGSVLQCCICEAYYRLAECRGVIPLRFFQPLKKKRNATRKTKERGCHEGVSAHHSG